MQNRQKVMFVVEEVQGGFKAVQYLGSEPTKEYIQTSCVFKLRDILTSFGYTRFGRIGVGGKKLETWL